MMVTGVASYIVPGLGTQKFGTRVTLGIVSISRVVEVRVLDNNLQSDESLWLWVR